MCFTIDMFPSDIEQLMQTNDDALYDAMLLIYEFQTDEEKEYKETVEENGMGFTAYDADFLSSLCEYLIKYGKLSIKQKDFARKKMIKYKNQIYKAMRIKD